MPVHTPRSSSTPGELLKSRIARLSAELPRALAGQEEGLHQMRVASRRLRVALPALAQKPRGQTVRRCRATLRRLVRLAGQARDLDVAFALFRAAPVPERGRRPHWSVLRRRLRESRRRSRARLVERLLDADLAGLRRDLRRVAARLPIEASVAQTRLARRLAAERDRFILGFRRLGRRLDVDALHALRRGVRRLRYIAELQEELARREPRASGPLKDLQDRLGRLRDVALLERWLAAQALHARRRGASAEARVGRAGATRLGAVVRALHAGFLDRTPLAVVSRVAGGSECLRPGGRPLRATIGTPRRGPEARPRRRPAGAA